MSYYLERIQRGVDHIEARLDEDLPLGEVGRAAGMSQWHFQRIFKSLTGETLKTYIRSRRLARSLERLRTTKLRVLDVAILASFESQEAFARAFKKEFNLTPQEYRNGGAHGLLLTKPRFDDEYLQHLHQNVSLTPEIYLQPRMHLVGLRTRFFGVDSDKNNLGERLPSLWAAFLPRLAEIPESVRGVCYGVVRSAREDDDELVYDAAIEVREAGVLPEGMVSFELPATTYAKFTHRGPAKNVDLTVSYAYSTWLARTERRHTYGADLEIYGAGYHPTRDDSIIYYAIPTA